MWTEVPLDQINMVPLESPVSTSPLSANAKHVTYLGLSRDSKSPIFRAILPFSRDQKQTCPFPQVTKEWRIIGWNSTATIRSEEHFNKASSNVTLCISTEKKNLKVPWFRLFWHLFASPTTKDSDRGHH